MASHVLHEKRGRAGIITLNRPKAINALTLEMFEEITRILRGWESDPDVALVILRGAGERGLCAGGDIASLYQDAKVGGTMGQTFWKVEYELDYYIHTYPKPYVAIMNGIVLGGGVGLSALSAHRIVTDDSRVGMPETGIGYSPDAGGTYLLSRSPDRLGRHLAYTGLYVGAAETIDVGLADHYVPQDQLELLVSELASTGDVGVIERFAQPLGPGFGDDRDEMTAVYAAATPEETLERLSELAERNEDDHWSHKAAKAMRRNSPLGIKVAETTLNRGADMTLAEALTQEYWFSLNMQRHPEFVEGIRAQIVEKDRNPSWTYATLADVPANVVSDLTAFDSVPGAVPPEFN